MPRQDNRNNPLQIQLRAIHLPKRVSPVEYHRRLIEHIQSGEPLPSNWEVEISWRNPQSHGVTHQWRSDDFEDAIADSRSGFVGIIRDVLARRLRRLRGA